MSVLAIVGVRACLDHLEEKPILQSIVYSHPEGLPGCHQTLPETKFSILVD
jgi:hypothetical protein